MGFRVLDITQVEGKKTQGTVGTAGAAGSSDITKLLSNFATFLAGLEVRLGLTVYDFLTSVDFFSAQNGAEVTGGLTADEVVVTGNVEMANTSVLLFGPDATDGTYRLRIVSRELLIEEYVTNAWVERGAFKA